MKKSTSWMRKSILLTLLASVLTTALASVGPPTFTINQTNPATTVYLDPPTINGTAIGVGNTVTVNLMIRDAHNVHHWQSGMIFNATALECLEFKEGEFLKRAGKKTFWAVGTINNTAGVIDAHGATILGTETESGNGQLAYLTFKVKAHGVSDLHFRDANLWTLYHVGEVWVPVEAPFNIIDVYTVVVNTTPHTVVTVSDSTGSTAAYHSGFYNHAFNATLKELSFKVSGPKPGFSNVTIPKTLLPPPEPPIEWKVIIDGVLLSTGERIVTENTTHTFIYFTYSKGIHQVQITTRMSSTILMALSSDSIDLGSSVTISGNITAEDYTGRPNVTVTIQSRPVGAPGWNTAGQNLTDQNSNYTYIWTPETGGTHEVRTRWEGDSETLGGESEVLALIVLYVFEPVLNVYVVIETNSTVAELNSIPALDFSQTLKQISFNVTSPYGTGYSNVTIPKELLNVTTLDKWKVRINGTLLSTGERIVTENTTHTFIYFTYSKGIRQVQITTRMSSTILMALSSDSIDLGSSVTISGNITTGDNIARSNVTVTVLYKLSGENWTTLTVETDQNGTYTYPWEPEKAGIYEVMASWEGDDITFGNESEVRTLTVKEAGIPLEIVAVAVVAIIVIAAIVVYFVKVRKP